MCCVRFFSLMINLTELEKEQKVDEVTCTLNSK